ncbi:MAG TPA: hypothetical protein VM051_09060, partial [Usitatibacter sp.]|nr:hypothetical protein [Usitatibacter sp.]
MLKTIRFALACLFTVAGPVFAQVSVVVPGEPSVTPKATATPILRLAPKAVAVGVKLAPVAEAEMERLRETNRKAPVARKRLAVGIERDVVPMQGSKVDRWSAVPEGFAAQASLTSPGAGAVRMAIDLANVPGDVEMVFFGSDAPDHLIGPVRVADVKDRTLAWWSPVTDGEMQ